MIRDPDKAGTGIWALVPGAGYSSRMKAYKPLLPLGSSTIIGRVISLLTRAGVEGIIVVTGHNHDRLAPVVRGAGARVLFNPDYDKGMFSSIRLGAGALPDRCRGVFLLPADMPAIRAATLENVIHAFDGRTVVVPEFMGEPGHPPLIPAGVIPAILAAGEGGNLREILFSDHAPRHRVKSLPVSDRGILLDADLPGDYEKLIKRCRALDIPDPDECRALLDLEGVGPELAGHLERVAETALKLGQALNASFSDPDAFLDLDLIRAGALLHDIRRPEPDHARAGSELLLSLGMPRVAGIVDAHMDLVLPGRGLGEKEVVFLADKLCRGSCLELNYEPRFLQKAGAYLHARERIVNRLETARRIQARIETASGRSLGDILF